MLEDDRSRSQIVSLLRVFGDASARDARGARKPKPPNSKPVPRRSYVDSREMFELELSRSSIAKLRYIASGYGIPFSPKDSRQRLRRIILGAAQRGDIKLGNSPGSAAAKGGGDYARWAEIIFGGNRPRR